MAGMNRILFLILRHGTKTGYIKGLNQLNPHQQEANTITVFHGWDYDSFAEATGSAGNGKILILIGLANKSVTGGEFR
jgi:hypothetical protein